jgi:hypothetical protein
VKENRFDKIIDNKLGDGKPPLLQTALKLRKRIPVVHDLAPEDQYLLFASYAIVVAAIASGQVFPEDVHQIRGRVYQNLPVLKIIPYGQIASGVVLSLDGARRIACDRLPYYRVCARMVSDDLREKTRPCRQGLLDVLNIS